MGAVCLALGVGVFVPVVESGKLLGRFEYCASVVLMLKKVAIKIASIRFIIAKIPSLIVANYSTNLILV